MADTGEKGERIAKVMARAGVASRRDAERLIVEGRVAVNGVAVISPALDVLPSDRVTLDGKPVDAPQAARLWLYYKPLGLVTTEHDEKGRQTVFESLPDGLPRVMSVGRLDLNSEGLLLLTNDGALKRRLELPSTGWLRKYRVRVNGRPNEATFDPLRRGIEIEGETFQPMEIHLDRQQGANAWLTVGLREGKNREIRRAMTEVGLTVNRLIRVSYGPFRLNEMKPGEVIEVKQKVLKEQLGEGKRASESEDRRPRKPRPAASADRPGRGAPAPEGDRPQRPARARGDERPFAPRDRASEGAARTGEDRKDLKPRHGGASSRPDRGVEGQGQRPYAKRDAGSRPPRPEGPGRKPYARRDDDSRPPRAEGAERKPYPKREGDSRPPRKSADWSDRPDRGPRPGRDEDGNRPRHGKGSTGSFRRDGGVPGEKGARKPYERGPDKGSATGDAPRKPRTGAGRAQERPAREGTGGPARRADGPARPPHAGKPDRDRTGQGGKPRSGDRPGAKGRPGPGGPRGSGGSGGQGGKGPKGPRKPKA